MLTAVIPTAAWLTAGCAGTQPPRHGRDEPLHIVLPAQPRDEILTGPLFDRPMVVALDADVLAWHAATRWDELERRIRRAAARRPSVVVSLWRGEVLRSVADRRRHECWYLMVLCGSTFRPADGDAVVETVMSLDHRRPTAFLEAVEDALERCTREAGPPLAAAGTVERPGPFPR